MKYQYERGVVTDDAILVPIRKIEKKPYEGKLYDLTMPETSSPSFVIPNATIHNCRSGNPNDSGEFTVWGTFTIPKPSDPFLVAEIKRYHDQFKADFMEDSREELISR